MPSSPPSCSSPANQPHSGALNHPPGKQGKENGMFPLRKQHMETICIHVKTYFISPSVPDIRRKLQKLASGPSPAMNDFMKSAFSAFNNQSGAVEGNKSKERPGQNSHSPGLAVNGNQLPWGPCGQKPARSCHTSRKLGHWKFKCPQGPCPRLGKLNTGPGLTVPKALPKALVTAPKQT